MVVSACRLPVWPSPPANRVGLARGASDADRGLAWAAFSLDASSAISIAGCAALANEI